MTGVLAIRHVAFEDLGLLEPLLRRRGCTVAYTDAWAVDPAQAAAAGLLVILGGPISVNDLEGYPFLAAEIAAAERRLAENRPTLGICLGAQIMARAIGGTVAPGPEPEIGWGRLTLSEAGRASPLAALADVPVLHWHGEVCHLPDGLPSLAATPACSVQAFAPAPRALALQFHGEAGTAGLEPWLVGHTVEIGRTPGVDIATLRNDTARNGPALAVAGARMFTAWLDTVGVGASGTAAG